MARRTRTRTVVPVFEEVIVDRVPKRWTRELEAQERPVPAKAPPSDGQVVAWVMAGLMLLAIARVQPAPPPGGIKPAAMGSAELQVPQGTSGYWPTYAPGLY